MKKASLKQISAKMRNLDLCMLSTSNNNGKLSTRPMSNNKDVDYKGESFFFSDANTQKVKDIKQNRKVTLSFIGKKGLFLIINAQAKLITSRAIMEEHWVDSLNSWFEEGIDTPSLTLIAVKAKSIHYWIDNSEGEIKLK